MTPEEFEAIRNRATRPRRTVPIVCDGDLRQQIQELLAERDEIQAAAEAEAEKPKGNRRLSSRPPGFVRIAAIDAELDALYATAEASTLQVVMEGLSGIDYTAFRALYPAREGNEADKRWRFDTEAGRDPLIRACAIGYRGESEAVHPLAPPVLDPETGEVVEEGQIDWLLRFVSDWQRDVLFLASLNTCRGDDAVPLRPARSETPTSDAA